MIFYLLPFILIAYIFFPTLKETAEICYTNEDYSHGLILPFISIYFLYLDREKLYDAIAKTKEVKFSLLGLLTLVIGIFVFILGEISNLQFLRWFALYPTFLGAFILVFGKALFYEIAGPFILIFMSKPLPDSLVPKIFFPLQVFSAKVSAKVLELLGVPVYLKGNIIEIPGMQLMVEEACSGLRSVMALFTVAIIVVFSIELKNFHKMLLLLASLLVAIILNVFRVTSTGVLAHFYDRSAATGFFHTFSGLVVFTVGLVIIYSLGNFLKKLEK